MAKKKQSKKKVGRPPRPMPEQIPDTPENVARALRNTPPKRKDEWDHIKVSRKDKDR